MTLRRHRNAVIRRRRGFTLILAIAALGLAGMTLAAIAAHVSLQQRRTVSAIEDTQAAELLAAAVRIAEAQAAATPADGPVPTPVGDVRFTWSGEAGHRSCTIDVACGQARRAATVRFDGLRAASIE